MFKLIWSINNFSMLSQKYIDSPTFELKLTTEEDSELEELRIWTEEEIIHTNNVKACVRLFLKGGVLSDCITCYLLTKDRSAANFEVGTEVNVRFSKNSDNSRCEHLMVISDQSLNQSNPSHTSERYQFWGRFPRSAIDGIDKFQDLFLSEDNVQIECLITKSEPSTSYTIQGARTVVQIERHTFDLPLRELDRSEFQDRNVEYSEIFSVDEYSDCFELTLGVRKLLKNNTVGIRKMRNIDSAVTICCKISLFSENAETELICDRHIFEAASGNESWKKSFDIDASAIENFPFLRCVIIASQGKYVSVSAMDSKPESITTHTVLSRYKFDDSLLEAKTADTELGKCKFEESVLVECEGKKPSTEVSPNSEICLKSDKSDCSLLKTMYETKMCTDVTLQVGADQFLAHKSVLASVSDVFATMFTTKMKEKETNVVHITDIDSDVIEKMLQFVYAGTIEIFKSESLRKLYFAANMYQILELKKLCSFHLKGTLSKNTVLEVLELADMNQDVVLKEAARNFIHANRKEVLDSDKWKCFTGKHIELAADIMLHICKES